MQSPGGAASSAGDRRAFRLAVGGIGLTQVLAWGCVYYPIGVTGPLIARDLGLGLGPIYGVYAALLIASALVAPAVGAAIDRYGGRVVLGTGSVLAAGSLLATAMVHTVWAYAVCSVLLGLAAAMTLYDAAFPALVAATGTQGRRAITLVTLLGGFASTLSWPVTAMLAEHWGWRATYICYAAVMLVACLPINLLALPRRVQPTEVPRPPVQPSQTADAPTILTGAARRNALVLFALTIAANQLVASGFLIHILDFGNRIGLEPREAILIGMLFGPAQVLGRVGEMAFGARFSALTTGRLATSFLPLGLVLLLPGRASLATAILFALALGLSNGLMTIARGTVALALFGSVGYGAIIGQLTVPALLARAAGPFVFALVIESWGVRATLVTGLGVALAAVAGMELLALRRRRLESSSAEYPPARL